MLTNVSSFWAENGGAAILLFIDYSFVLSFDTGTEQKEALGF